MSIFSVIGDALRTGYGGVKQFAKSVSPGIVRGITAGLQTGRNIIDAGKNVIDSLQNIPYIGSVIPTDLIKLPLSVADKVVENFQGIDKAANQLGRDYDKGGVRNLGPAFGKYVRAVGNTVNLIPK